MLLEQKVAKINEESKQASWTYPEIFDALKAAGVVRYEVKVQSQQVVYYGLEENYFEPSRHPNELSVSDTFDDALVQRAIKRNQDMSTNYSQFLQEIASAGVITYQVDMASRTLTYQSKTGEQYIEKVPVGPQ